jgi:SM-20-related protein
MHSSNRSLDRSQSYQGNQPNNSQRQISNGGYNAYRQNFSPSASSNQNYNNQKIAPEQGTTVFFKSNELQHEVLVTQQQRMSITGWLKRDN